MSRAGPLSRGEASRHLALPTGQPIRTFNELPSVPLGLTCKARLDQPAIGILQCFREAAENHSIPSFRDRNGPLGATKPSSIGFAAVSEAIPDGPAKRRGGVPCPGGTAGASAHSCEGPREELYVKIS